MWSLSSSQTERHKAEFYQKHILKHILIILNYAVKFYFFFMSLSMLDFSFWVYSSFKMEHNNRTKTSLLKKCPALICLHTLTYGGFRSLNPPSFSLPFVLWCADLTAVALYFNLTVFFFPLSLKSYYLFPNKKERQQSSICSQILIFWWYMGVF